MAVSHDRAVLGLATFMPTFSLVEPMPEMRRQVQLKALYVRSAQRGRGIGRALMAWISRYAVDSGYCRIDWPVRASSARAISFYEGLGARRVVDRLSYRLTEPNMSRLAGQRGEASIDD